MRRGYLAVITCLAFLSLCISPGSAVVTLSMGLTASPSPVVPGDQLTYTITASNTGDEASSATIDFYFDPNLVDYLSASPVSNQELYGEAVGSPAYWVSSDSPERIVEILPGGSYTITVVTRVKAGVPCETPIESTATVVNPLDGSNYAFATASVTTATTPCGIPAPEFPSPVLPVAMLGLLTLGIVIIRSRTR
jgi:hypothetical protein